MYSDVVLYHCSIYISDPFPYHFLSDGKANTMIGKVNSEK